MNRLMYIFILTVFLAACLPEKKLNLVPLDYADWEKTTEEQLNFPIPGHEDHLRVIYINDIGRNIYIENRGNRTFYTFTEGTIIVKEAYSSLSADPDTEEPINLTVMIKEPEHPDARAGWLWIIKNPVTGEETIRNDDFCVDCHAVANQQHPYGEGNLENNFCDYVFYIYKEE